jgi:hypothetical protein
MRTALLAPHRPAQRQFPSTRDNHRGFVAQIRYAHRLCTRLEFAAMQTAPGGRSPGPVLGDTLLRRGGLLERQSGANVDLHMALIAPRSSHGVRVNQVGAQTANK